MRVFARGVVAAGLVLVGPALADNPMGYRLETKAEASALPRGGGTLGIEAERADTISDGGLTFALIRVKAVRPGSAAAQAGLAQGARIVAVDGLVFPDLATFAAYVAAVRPGARLTVDAIPPGGGPAQAQRLGVTAGGG